MHIARILHVTIVGKVRREWMGGRHVLFPARSEGKKDEEAEVAEGVDVFIFFWTKECAGANSFDEEFEPFVNGVDMCGVVMVRNLVMGGRLGILPRA